MSKTKRRRKPSVTVHLWAVVVRHRDYPATMNSTRKTLYMKETSLWIESPRMSLDRPDIHRAIAKAESFLRRNRKMFGMPEIRGATYRGTIDR